MKTKVYIVTYKRNDILNTNLKSLWENTKNPDSLEVTVLSNHPDIKIDRKNRRKNLRVVINTTRMPHAWGNLAKDWNYAILDCFKNIYNPENVDWLVLAQNDVTWVKDWDLWLENNKDYDLVTQPKGDQSIALNIEAVKKIGFFDERLTTLHYHEIDYFIRAILHLGNRVSVNDNHKYHNLTTNYVGNVITAKTSFGFCDEDETLHNRKNWKESNIYITNKWQKAVNDIDFAFVDTNRDNLLKLNSEINWYPFFYYPIKEDVPAIKFRKIRKLLACAIPSKELRRKIRGDIR